MTGSDHKENYYGGNSGGDVVGALPLKSWYIPGTMMMMIASNLLRVNII